MKKIVCFSLVLISAFAKDCFAEQILATENFVRSGLSNRVTNTELTTAISGKANLQTGAVAGNVAAVDAAGQYVDSGSALSSLATTSGVATSLAAKANLQTGSTAGNVATMNAAGQYVDSGSALSSLATTSSVTAGLNTKLNLSGGTMSGAINMGNNKVTNMATPTTTTDATTKAYVDAYHTPPPWATLNAASWAVPG